ncbi:MAG TPA: lysylphosphatidylglycerol synthase transmembrane domain-containing protein [Candidatus Dormibacteraeota bacterium]|jgi:uncharacterized membrane protein YbhN (UPF0104 family)|nr:lysylphosphatidylglycerol synthase transmembrane domain-containing protein [Candidatus Dormibacteraeota bacterium]
MTPGSSGRAGDGEEPDTPELPGAAGRVQREIERRPRVRRGLGFVRRHWLETLAVLFLVGLIVAVGPSHLVEAYRRARWIWIVLMIPVALAIYLFRGIGWWVALRGAGVEIGLGRGVAIMFAGQTMIFMPAGDLARVALVEESGGGGEEGTVAGTIAFQELLFLALLGLGVLPRAFAVSGVALLVLVMTASHVGVFTLLLWRPAYDWAVAMVERFRLLRRFDRQLRELRPAFVAMFRWRTLLPLALCNVLAALTTYGLFALALEAMGARSVGPINIAFAYGLAHLLSGLSFLPGGIGSMEVVLVAVLARMGVATPVAAATAVLFRVVNDGLMALVGLGVGWTLRRRSRARRVDRD